MLRCLLLFVALALAVAAPLPASPEAQPEPPNRCRSAVSWQNARKVVGMIAEVRGRVVGATYARSSSGRPTFLYLGRRDRHPKRFTVVIWGRDRAEFGAPEQRYRGRTICVIGRVMLERGAPQTEVTTPSQIRIVK